MWWYTRFVGSLYFETILTEPEVSSFAPEEVSAGVMLEELGG